MQPLSIGVNTQWRFTAVLAGSFFFALLAVERQPNADRRLQNAIAQPHLFGIDVDRLLLAAVWAVAYQAFADDVRRHLNFILPRPERLKVLDDGGLRCVTRLQIERAQRHHRQQPEEERELRRTAQRNCGSRQRKAETAYPDERRAPQIVCYKDSRCEGDRQEEYGLQSAAINAIGGR